MRQKGLQGTHDMYHTTIVSKIRDDRVLINRKKNVHACINYLDNFV